MNKQTVNKVFDELSQLIIDKMEEIAEKANKAGFERCLAEKLHSNAKSIKHIDIIV